MRTCLLTALGLLLAAGPTQAGPAEGSKKPNILFIAIDDLNDWISPLAGHPDARTPNFDRLAKRSITFTRAYCPAPACNPSRAALLTGRLPSSSGVYHNDQPWRPPLKDAVTLPQHFIKHGYRVQAAGKIFHGGAGEAELWHAHFGGGPDAKPSREVAEHPNSRAGGIVWGHLDVPDEQTKDHRLVSHAIDFLSKKHDQPFFFALGLHKPHMPWNVPKKYYDLYDPEKITLPNVPADDLADIPAAGLKMAKPEGDHATILKTNNHRHAVRAYLATISYTDAQLGRILDALDASPARANTILVLWGDHGWHLGEKHHWRKFALWEEATRVPLFISAPTVTKDGSRCDRTVNLMDLYPTLSDLCSLPLPGEQVQGRSLLPLLSDPAAEWNHPSLTTHGRSNHALRSERYRYIRYADGSEELYDHSTDPNEWKNLANDPAQAAVKADLARHLPRKDAADAPRRAADRPRRRQA